MIINDMKQKVFEGNLALPHHQLVKLTWGNVSLINREEGIICIKPSGVPYDNMKPEDMVITDLDGRPFEKQLKPSSDLETHVVLYKNYTSINSIVHTHSLHAVVYAQAGKEITPLGTTHADTFYGAIPCTRDLTAEEVNSCYESATGKVIIEKFKELNVTPKEIPAINTRSHGPFIFGETVDKAIENTIILEEVAEMALKTELLNPEIKRIHQYLLDKHYYRKHGEHAYYGQG